MLLDGTTTMVFASKETNQTHQCDVTLEAPDLDNFYMMVELRNGYLYLVS